MNSHSILDISAYTLLVLLSVDSMTNLGLPLLLLAALWGAFTPLLKAIELLNERRDKVVDPNSKLTAMHRRLILFSDWLPIYVASYAFLGIVGFLLYSSPSFFDLSDATEIFKNEVGNVFHIAGGTMVAFGVIGFFTGFVDFFTMMGAIKKTLDKSNHVWP